MAGTSSGRRDLVMAAVLGAMGGGVVVAIATRAIPKIMAQMMAGTMQNMMAQMEKCGLDPAVM